MKNFIVLILVTLTSNIAISQTKVNDYKYVLVPNKFDFLKEANQYQLNDLSKFLFEKYGFTTIKEDESMPEDAINNGCLVLKSDVLKEKSLFKTKLVIQLKNCRNEIVYNTAPGESREKDYKTAYNLALRAAFEHIKALNYEYNANASVITNSKRNTNEIEKLKKEIKTLKKETNTNQVVKTKEEIAPLKEATEVVIETKSESAYHAEAIDNGFILKNNTTNSKFIIFYSSLKDVFIVKGKEAILYKENNTWRYSEANESAITARVLDIKF